MSRRVGLRRRQRRRKQILFAGIGLFVVAAITMAVILILNSAKKVPDGQEGESQPASSVLISADELMQNGDFDGALALLAATPQEDENYSAAMEKIVALSVQRADSLYAADETAYDKSIAALNQGLTYMPDSQELKSALEKYQQIKQSKESSLWNIQALWNIGLRMPSSPSRKSHWRRIPIITGKTVSLPMNLKTSFRRFMIMALS